MHRSSGTATGSQRNRISGNGGGRPDGRASGEDLARLFKYFRQLNDPGRNFTVPPLCRISAGAFYREHKAAFDRTSDFFSSHGLDAKPYVAFFVNDLGKTGSDVDGDLFSRASISRYAAKLQAAEKKRKIWAWFQKSVANIADMCVREDYMSGKDCVLALIRRKRIAQEFVSGRISKYFFAAMPNFRNVIPKLDHFARAEFAELYDKFDIYNTEINETFLAYRNRTVNPLSIVDEELAMRRRSKARPGGNELFDPDL